MNELPRTKLREIVSKRGKGVVREGRRVEGLLRDYCGEHRREVSVLVAALEEHVPEDLLAAPASAPREALLARLARRLCDNLALSEAAARWAVNSWALALGLVTEEELKALERSAPATEQREPVAGGAGPAPAQTAPGKGGGKVVVSADGRGHYRSIGEALQRAAPGTTILVRPGVYEESVTLDRQVEIVGDGPRDQISVRAANASCISMRTDRARVAGLTLRGVSGGTPSFAVDVTTGSLLLEDCAVSSDTLSGVGVHGERAAPVIRGCLIHDARDSGVYFFDGAKGEVEDCEVARSANVGVAVTGGASPAIRRTKIHGGADAGLVVWGGGSAVVEACEIYDNRRAGLGVSEGGRARVRACRIHGGDNSGVFVHDRGDAVLEDCDVHGHREAEVAVDRRGQLMLLRCEIHDGLDSGVFVRGGGQTLIQECTVMGNASAGVVVGENSIAELLACRVVGNGGAGIKVAGGGSARVSDSDLSGNAYGPWDADEGAYLEGGGNREE
ncbi:MAG TPA: right-handed parallel beta-helix repeat-containing protein [Pyrinomonadaceae bacterium]|nr:right-handed parallel beta-helix repeat-containing protein [Pyrinomonadaceae bacterium]